MLGNEHQNRARDQVLNFLEINSNKVLEGKAENLHYEKYLGVAEMTPQAMLDFCRRVHPDKYDTFAKEMEDHPETLYLDFENVFSKLEELPVYQELLQLIKTGVIKTLEQKSWIAMFLTHHVLRSHVYVNKLTDAYKNEGMDKFEALVKLKWSLEDPNFMAWESFQLVDRHWIVYNLDRPILPLSDCPIVGSPSGVLFATLAPHIILAVERKRAVDLGISYINRIPSAKFKEYMRCTIGNTSKGLIFTDKKDLLKCQDSVWWKKRRRFI